MRQGDVRDAVLDCGQSAAAAAVREKEGCRRLASRVEVAQNSETRVVAARREKKFSLVRVFAAGDSPAIFFDPFIDQPLGENPLTGDPRTRELAGLGHEIDLLLIDPDVLRHFLGT